MECGILLENAAMKPKTKQASPDPESRYKVPVVCSTFRILEELSKAGALGLNEITQRTGVAKSTVFRVLTTLRLLGYVIRDAHRNYSVGHSLADLFSDIASSESLKLAAMPCMLRLRDQFGETVNLGQLRHDKVVYLEVVPSEYALRLHERPGATVDAHASALGKAILAFSPPPVAESLVANRKLSMLTRKTITDPVEFSAELRRVRERGYAFDRGEASLLATCVGAPILDARGNALAGLSISGPSSRFNPKKDAPAVEGLLAAVAEISKRFQQRPASS
jgi:IclR family acetate operon transcriptional repressor